MYSTCGKPEDTRHTCFFPALSCLVDHPQTLPGGEHAAT